MQHHKKIKASNPFLLLLGVFIYVLFKFMSHILFIFKGTALTGNTKSILFQAFGFEGLDCS